MKSIEQLLGKQHIIYQDENGQIYTSPSGGYDIVTHGSNQKEKYARLLKKLKQNKSK